MLCLGAEAGVGGVPLGAGGTLGGSAAGQVHILADVVAARFVVADDEATVPGTTVLHGGVLGVAATNLVGLGPGDLGEVTDDGARRLPVRNKPDSASQVPGE